VVLKADKAKNSDKQHTAQSEQTRGEKINESIHDSGKIERKKKDQNASRVYVRFVEKNLLNKEPSTPGAPTALVTQFRRVPFDDDWFGTV
jgi:hypothetical protein